MGAIGKYYRPASPALPRDRRLSTAWRFQAPARFRCTRDCEAMSRNCLPRSSPAPHSPSLPRRSASFAVRLQRSDGRWRKPRQLVRFSLPGSSDCRPGTTDCFVQRTEDTASAAATQRPSPRRTSRAAESADARLFLPSFPNPRLDQSNKGRIGITISYLPPSENSSGCGGEPPHLNH